ncbi:MAG: AAA family ATPase [Bacteroidales bacterium]
MVIGLFLRNYRGYADPVFIPLSEGYRFTGLIGENGVGKTTVLMALDSFFNEVKWERNYYDQKRLQPEAFVQPFFLIRKEQIPLSLMSFAEQQNHLLRNRINEEKSNNENNLFLSGNVDSLKKIANDKAFENNYLLISIGADSEGSAIDVTETMNISCLSDYLTFLRKLYNYVFIHSQIELDQFFSSFKLRYNINLHEDAIEYSQNEYGSFPIDLLDSQQKQQLMIRLLKNLLINNQQYTWILGFDEPEMTLQMSVCYEHFEEIYHLQDLNSQVLLTSHWYGFIPLMTNGLLVDIIKEKAIHRFIKFDIARIREEIKIRKRIYKEKYHEELPVDVKLKTINDFIQTVLGSVIYPPYYNWLICEGSSELIYFNYYFEEQIRLNRLRIVPVGGIREVRKIYAYLNVPFGDLKEYIHGKVILLTDTDTQLLEFDTPVIPNLSCFRLINTHGDTALVHISSNPKSPKTEIEDALNGRVFHKALCFFKTEYPDLLDFVTDEDTPEMSTYYSLNLSPSDNDKLTTFFDFNHTIKSRFAQKYIEICRQGEFRTPSWIEKLKELLA